MTTTLRISRNEPLALESADATLAGAAERELAEETSIDPGTVPCVSRAPVYVE